MDRITSQRPSPERADELAQRRASEAHARLSRGDLAGALDLLRREAVHHPALCVMLAECLLFFAGDPVAIDEAKSSLIAVEPDDPKASYLLAWLGLGGRVLPLDMDAIAARIDRAGAAGHPLALRALAFAAADTDAGLSRSLLAEGMRMGDPIAALLLAERWKQGEGDPAERASLPALEARLRASGYPPLPLIGGAVAARSADGAGSIARLAEVRAARPLAGAPRVDRIDGLFSAEECRFLVAMARPLLKRSTVHDPSSGDASALPVRTSSDAAFDVMHEDVLMRLLIARMARSAGLEPSHGEPLIVLNYQLGEAYRPHRDYLAPSALAASRPEAGQRRATVCAYLNTVDEGGGTSFPELALQSPAEAGAAVVFDNLRSDGSPEPRSLHAGDPVLRGEKWLATLWLRERPIRDF